MRKRLVNNAARRRMHNKIRHTRTLKRQKSYFNFLSINEPIHVK